MLKKINAIIRDFWWTGIQEDSKSKPIYFKAWAEICKSKKEGGLGVRNLEAINKALILNTAWKIVTLPDSYTSKILMAKYFHNTSFWKANPKVPKSAFWTSILKVKNQLADSVNCQFFRGNTSIWSAPWCPFWKEIHNQLNIQDKNFVYPATVSDLCIPNTKVWNISLLTTLFGAHNASLVANIPINKDNGDDMLIWKHTPSGICTSKSAYQVFCPSFYGLNAGPYQSLTPQTRKILQEIWKCGNIPPRVQVFGWRLMRGAIATGMRTAVRSNHIDPLCTRCGNKEDDFHLFFDCKFSQAVWFASPLGLRVEGLYHLDNTHIQNTISYILSFYKNEDALQKVLCTLWCIWKARNNLIFKRIKSTPLQVLFKAKAIQAEKEKISNGKDQELTSKKEKETRVNYLEPDPNYIERGPNIYTDAAWKHSILATNRNHIREEKSGIGIYIDWKEGDHHTIYIQAASVACSALQAEAQALELAAHIARSLQLQEPKFLTDNLTLAQVIQKKILQLILDTGV
jgi:hypothetical protein